MADIRKRKKKLEDDLELLEGDFEKRISSAQKKVFGPLQPIELIKKNPFKSVGTSILVGVAIGLMGKGKSATESTSVDDSQKEKLFDLLFTEVKRVAARKAATYLSDFIDEKISNRERE
ncbi:MAG: hypothetical protein U5K72_10545 [Balneolaceae bacterium]|nr:hypothetical protein [Balneolaceae bacterium]